MIRGFKETLRLGSRALTIWGIFHPQHRSDQAPIGFGLQVKN